MLHFDKWLGQTLKNMEALATSNNGRSGVPHHGYVEQVGKYTQHDEIYQMDREGTDRECWIIVVSYYLRRFASHEREL